MLNFNALNSLFLVTIVIVAGCNSFNTKIEKKSKESDIYIIRNSSSTKYLEVTIKKTEFESDTIKDESASNSNTFFLKLKPGEEKMETGKYQYINSNNEIKTKLYEFEVVGEREIKD